MSANETYRQKHDVKEPPFGFWWRSYAMLVKEFIKQSNGRLDELGLPQSVGPSVKTRLYDGLTGEQRFFLAFARRWRKLQTEAALRQQIKTDTHSPSEFRSDTVRNVDAWYETYKVAPGDKLYLKPEERARIW